MADISNTLLTTTVVHHVPGRLRLRVRGARPDAVSLDQVANRLRRIDAVQAVRANPASSSIVIHYQANDDDFALRILHHPALSRWPLRGLGVQAEEGAASRPLPHRSHVAQAIMTTSLRLDSSVRQATAGYVDLKLLLPVVFAAASSYMVRSRQGTPMWMTLAVSAFNSFLSLHPAQAPYSGRGGDASPLPAA